MRKIKFEYGFNSVNGIVKKVYHLHEIPFMHDKCDVWQILPVAYVRQFTGLTDKNGRGKICLYEGDILSLDGIIKGNIYENKTHQTEPYLVIPKITSKDWMSAYKEAMDRGFGYPE
jgi:hypothetical protein